MGDKRNFAALDWVIGEISETLKDARQALEAYVEDPKDSTRIRFCLTHIHQVHGSLQMVEFYGASLLAEEMEHLAQALMDHKVTSAPEAQEVLMRSLLQLPTYLDHVKALKEDNPGLVLPLLNDLRAVRNQSYLSETNLFSPNLQMLKEVYGTRHPITQNKTKLTQVLKKLREMYQFAAASVLRGIKVEENLIYLDKVFSRLEALTIGSACYPLWEVSAALIEGLLRDDIELSVAVRGLLRHLARELRILGEKAPSSLDFTPRESLLKNLLYYVARAESGGKKINRIKKRYILAEALLDGVTIGENGESDSLSAPDPEAIRSVVVALNDEINAIKNVLDLSLSGHAEPQEMKEILPVVKRVADTLAVLGIGDLRKQVNTQYDVIEDLSKQNDFDEARLLGVAGKIIEIEHRLDAIAKVVGTHRDLASVNEREIEIDQAKVTVIKECQHGLEQAKDAIVEYISSKWDKSHLLNVGSLLHDIRGGLDMIPLPRPASILESCAYYIQEQLLDKDQQPSWQSLDTLADAISSVEYYLERLLGDMEGDTDSLLDVAESSVAELGYPLKVTEVIETPRAEAVSPQSHQDSVAVAAEPETEVQAVDESAASPSVEPSADVTEIPKTADAVHREGISLDQISIDEDEMEESDIDDEIIEIFIEEAGEVSETLAEYCPQWKANQQDQDSLVVVRRAFHTLKGSGRMVEAHDIGELAWSVENMLNRVIDNAINPALPHSHIMELVLNLLPVLIDAFANKKRNPQKAITEQYMAWAQSMSEGNIPAELQAIPDGAPLPLPDFTATVQPAVVVQAATAPVDEPLTVDAEEADDDDDENLVLWEIFSSEAFSHLATMENFIAKMEREAPLYSPPSDDFQRALHTLKGSAKMAQVTPIATITEPLESFAKELISYQVDINTDILQLYRDAVSYARQGLAQIEAREPIEIDRLDQFVARTAELRELAVGHLIRLKEMEKDGQKQVDPRLLSIFMAEEMNLLLDADQIIQQWQQSGTDDGKIEPIIKELATLDTGAQQAQLPDMASLSAQLRTLYEQAQFGQQDLNEDFFTILAGGHESLLDMIDSVAAGQNVVSPSEEITSALASLIHVGNLAPAIDSDAVAAEANENTAEDEVISESQSSHSDFAPLMDVANDDAVDEPDVAHSHLNEDDIFDIAVDSTFSGDLGDSMTSEDDGDIVLVDEIEPDDQEILVEEVPSNTLDDHDFGEMSVELVEEPEYVQADDELDNDVEVEAIEYDLTPLAEETLGDDIGAADEQQTRAFESAEPDAEEFVSAAKDEDEGPTLESLLASVPSEDVQGEQIPDVPVDDISAFEVEPEQSHEVAQTGIVPPGLLDIINVNDEDFDQEIMSIFLEEADELVEALDESVHAWESDWSALNNADEIKRALHTLKGGARLAGMTNLGELAHNYESFLVAADLTLVDHTFFAAMHDYQDKVLRSVGAVQAFIAGDTSVAPVDDGVVPVDEIRQESMHESSEFNATMPEIPEEVASELTSDEKAIPGLLDTIDVTAEDYDPDIIDIFLEEADELIEELDEAVHAWESNWSNTESPEQIKRVLHTLKGGARLAGMTNLGELTHNYESFLIGAKPDDVDDSFFSEMHQYQDKVLIGVRAIQGVVAAGGAKANISAEPVITPTAEVTDTDPKQDHSTAESNVLPFAPKPREPETPGQFVMPSVNKTAGGGGQQAAMRKQAGPQEVVKVNSDLLEELVNLAGETSISRARIEQQVSDFGHALEDIDATIARLQEQLRRLDIETEAQVLFRQEQMQAHEDFDPLEMDRYSQLQQLSRSLIESASDLVDLRQTLTDNIRDTETLLLQQSRINTTLQEGLMRSRMVPFSRLVPRLRRIVRQVAGELGKNVSFELDNIEGELDRSMLERMVPPLEHMLRNAVDHGIESPEQRLDSGKSETGRIVLTLGREGGDVILRLADDGQGVNLRRVREKAIERGLMVADSELSDFDIMQFVLHAGFSTAETVTQISGRGVGMDVVSSEIKAMGGSVLINSEWSKGTEIVVRLPFTVSVNRALMVQIGPDIYAIPLNTIEGIVRVSPFELEHYYTTEDARFEYAGENYQVRYLGTMLNADTRPILEGQALPLPVLLVRSVESTLAIQVDSLLGSREVVVKSLGSQFSAVQGLSGATLMGDGSVVVILDPHALVRQAIANTRLLELQGVENEFSKQDAADSIKTVMVVDDSVTVRKVTTRFLEREGFNVITAKDGVDALRTLQDEIPDVMLLDIEMPRMDGFEVAKNIRTTSRWKHIPIIMITSRTGEKHRERAMELGVDKYMGKPYQEDVLLEGLNELLAKAVKV